MEQGTTAKLCECGCGQPAPIAKANHTRTGAVKGQPVRFVKGHSIRNGRAPWFKGNEAGYRAIHTYLSKHFPKTGACDECGETRRTEYALIKGREYSRDREDYRELYKLCHNRYDEIGGSRWRGVTTARKAAGDAPPCGCGCGEPVTWDGGHARWRAYRRGHRAATVTPKPPLPAAAACDYCGGEYAPRARNARFCSAKCSAAERRASGKDDVERTCHQCGGAFTCNRFDAARHCSKSCSATCQHAGGCPR